MTDARSWLPPGISFAAVDASVARIVRSWSRNWFGDDEVAVAPGISMAGPLSSEKRHPCARDAWLVASDDAVVAMGRTALHLERKSHDTPLDRSVLESVGRQCLATLREMLALDLPLVQPSNAEPDARSSPSGDAVIWKIERKRTSVRLEFAMTDGARVECLLGLQSSPPSKPPLAPPDAALAALEVDVAADLGTCGLRISELKALAPGDVLVLGRELSAALPLVVNGGRAPGGMCKVSREADTLLLEIAAPLIGRNK